MIDALNTIAAHTSPPILWMADRESSLLSLFQEGKWIVERDHISAEGFLVQLCPALGSSHVNHSIVERRVQSLKLAFGSLNFEGSGWDSVMFTNFLFRLQSCLNNTPVANRLHSRDIST